MQMFQFDFFFQGICSAYDILIQCRVDLLQVAGLRKPGPTGSPSHSPKHRLQHYEDDHEVKNKPFFLSYIYYAY